jgi:hypothetical protein
MSDEVASISWLLHSAMNRGSGPSADLVEPLSDGSNFEVIEPIEPDP